MTITVLMWLVVVINICSTVLQMRTVLRYRRRQAEIEADYHLFREALTGNVEGFLRNAVAKGTLSITLVTPGDDDPTTKPIIH